MKHDSRIDIRIDAHLKQQVQQKLQGKKLSDFVRQNLEEFVGNKMIGEKGNEHNEIRI